MDKQKIAYIDSSDKSKITKNKALLEYLEFESQATKQIYIDLINSNNRFLDYESLYPQEDLKNQLVGIFDPMSCHNNLIDLFPFYNRIICIIRERVLQKPDGFKTAYSCSLEQLIELHELGKILITLPANPYLDDSSCQQIEPLYKKRYPSHNRCMKILQNSYLNDGLAGAEYPKVLTEIIRLHALNSAQLYKMLGLKEPQITQLIQISSRSIYRGEIAQAFKFSDWAYRALNKKNENLELMKSLIVHGFLDIDCLFELPFIAPGSFLNYSSFFMEFMQEEAEGIDEYVSKIFKCITNVTAEDLLEFIIINDTSPKISGDILAILKDSFIYQPPEYYNNPMNHSPV